MALIQVKALPTDLKQLGKLARADDARALVRPKSKEAMVTSHQVICPAQLCGGQDRVIFRVVRYGYHVFREQRHDGRPRPDKRCYSLHIALSQPVPAGDARQAELRYGSREDVVRADKGEAAGKPRQPQLPRDTQGANGG